MVMVVVVIGEGACGGPGARSSLDCVSNLATGLPAHGVL